MNILNLFRTKPMTATLSETEIPQRLAEVQRMIAAGEGDLVALLEERESLKRQIQALAIARQSREDAEYRARMSARRDNFLRELETELANIWRVMPELRWHLLGLRQLEKRLEEIGDGRSWEDVTGLPFGLADRLSVEIGQALAGTRLGQEAYTPGEVSKPIMGPMPERILRMPRFAGDMAPPPGFVGAWDPIRGQPFVEGEGTSGMFLPIGG